MSELVDYPIGTRVKLRWDVKFDGKQDSLPAGSVGTITGYEFGRPILDVNGTRVVAFNTEIRELEEVPEPDIVSKRIGNHIVESTTEFVAAVPDPVIPIAVMPKKFTTITVREMEPGDVGKIDFSSIWVNEIGQVFVNGECVISTPDVNGLGVVLTKKSDGSFKLKFPFPTGSKKFERLAFAKSIICKAVPIHELEIIEEKPKSVVTPEERTRF